jgi:ribose transport system substrate-binding protein
MKRRLLLAGVTAAGAVAVGLMALPRFSDAQQAFTFALVPKAMNNPFFDLARDGCMQAQRDSNGRITCLYIGPGEHTETEQVQIVQDLITRRVAGIAVSPSNAPAMGRVLRAAREAGIPTITWDSDLLPADAQFRTTFIGTRNYNIGVELAKLAQQLKPNGGRICLQTGGAAAANHNERLQGIRDTLSGATDTRPPGTRLTGQRGWTEVDGCPLITNDDGAVAVQQLADILGRYADLDVYITTGAFTQWSDNAFRQAIGPHRARLQSNSLIFLSADTLAMQMQQLRDGLSHGQVGQRPFQMGQLAMQRLLDIREGRQVPDPIYTGLDVCTRANAATCLNSN